jgi:hypothetical protein
MEENKLEKSKYGKYVVTELQPPDLSPEYHAEYAQFATRILYMDNNVVNGAFQMNCSWYNAPTAHLNKSHTHDSDEIIGFFGSNPQQPHELGAEIEFWLEDEKFILTKSTMIFVPKGMKHCPLIIHRVDRPVFHFSTLTEGQYVKSETP